MDNGLPDGRYYNKARLEMAKRALGNEVVRTVVSALSLDIVARSLHIRDRIIPQCPAEPHVAAGEHEGEGELKAFHVLAPDLAGELLRSRWLAFGVCDQLLVVLVGLKGPAVDRAPVVGLRVIILPQP